MSSASADALLAHAIATLARSADAEGAMASLLASAASAVGAERAAVVMWDSERGRLAVAATVGY